MNVEVRENEAGRVRITYDNDGIVRGFEVWKPSEDGVYNYTVWKDTAWWEAQR